MFTDKDLAGLLIQEKNEQGLISRCVATNADYDNANKFAVGCVLVQRDTGKIFINKGTSAVPSWVNVNDVIDSNDKISEKYIQYAEVEISSANIVATGAGKLGHANGVTLVEAPGADKVIELISAVLIYDYDTAAYTDGGTIAIKWGAGGAAITGTVSAANSLGASADKVVQFIPLATAGNALSLNTAISLVASAAFTNPGTAAGVVRVKVAYRVHTTNLA